MSDASVIELRPLVVIRRTEPASILLRRWWSTIVDYVAAALALVAAVSITPTQWQSGAVIAWICLVLLYFPLTEGLYGRSLGKLAAGLIVVGRDGRPPGLGRAALRTLLRLFEVNPLLLGGIPAAIAVGLSANRQRLGDMIADTYVVPFKELQNTAKSEVDVFQS